MTPAHDQLVRRGLLLQYATIAWNVPEAILTIALGIAAGSLALIGFGIDSFIEIFASVVVVWHLRGGEPARLRERTRRALQLVAGAFLALGIILAVVAVRDLVSERRADESIWGIAYLAITAVVMFTLARLKQRTAEKLDSAPFRSEATMTLLDAGLAAGTLIGLALNAAFGWWWADPAAALLVAVAALNEARENWEEAAELGRPTGR